MKPGSDRTFLLLALLGLLSAPIVRAEGSNLDALPSLDDGASVASQGDPAGTAEGTSGPTLDSAYQGEVNDLSTEVGGLKEKSEALDAAQKKVKKKLGGILNQTAVRVNGRGLAWVWHDRSFAPWWTSYSSATGAGGVLDLLTSGVIGKDVQWGFLGRVRSGLIPSETDPGDSLSIRRVFGKYTPSFLSLTLGDFDESYTPLTLWNRSALDWKVVPDYIGRTEGINLYLNGFLDKSPFVPLRGIRLGVKFDKPDSKIVQGLEASTFVHMIKNGFKEGAYGVGFTDWCVGGKGVLKFRPWASLEGYGMLYNSPPDTDGAAAVYDDFVSSTWPHRYWVGSFRPKVESLVGYGVTAGVEFEVAGTKYEANLYRPERTLSDFAYLGGPFLKKGSASLKFQYLEVGPSFYSPFAQIRQKDAASSYAGLPSLTTLGDPSGYFKTYDRTKDNVFPYGLATPNRKGFGLDLEMKGLKDKAFMFSASAYRVEEIEGNLVVDETYNNLVPVEDPALSAPPLRTFTYVNAGSKLDVAKLLGLKKPLELGLNVRTEKTESVLGTLDGTSVVPGLKVGMVDGWEWNLAFEFFRVRGTEAGLDGSLWARYGYWYDPTDRGHYSLMTVDATGRTAYLSTSIRMGKNGRLSLDGVMGSVENGPPSDRSQRYQSVGLIHELQF